jgi:hypothetical protein
MKKITSGMLLVGFALLTFGCSTLKVNHDWDREQDFTKYKTFDFLTPPVDYRASDLVMKRVYSSIALEMKNKGLTRVTNDADLWIAVHTGVQDKVDVQTWGYHYAPYYWYGYWGPSSVTAYRYEEGHLIIDMVDGDDEELVWRGVASAVLPDNPNPQRMSERVANVVARLLDKFPPKK